MTKSFLLTGAALVLLTASSGFTAETPAGIRDSLENLIGNQPLLNGIVDTDRIQITQDGSDFVLTLPKADAQDDQPPLATVRLMADGTFNGQDQYRINGVFDTLKTIVTDLVPNITLTTEQSESHLIWVPRYNLISQSSQNIRGLRLEVPPYGQVSVGQIVTDSLAQMGADNRLDQAASQDITNITVAAQGMTLTVPSISYQGNVRGALLTSNTLRQALSAEQASYQLIVPTLMVSPTGGQAPLATMAFATRGLYQDNVFHMQARADKITLDSTLRGLLPITVMPSQIELDADISGLNVVEFQSQIDALQATGIPEDEAVQTVLAEFGNRMSIQINRLEAKNAEAGILVQGTLKNQDNTPDIDLTVTITNLDKISPPPAVDQAQCDEARKQLAAVDSSAPDAATQKTVADFVVAQACTPRGGFLDDLRPYLDPQSRTADGKDILKIQMKGGVLTVNGKPVGDLPLVDSADEEDLSLSQDSQ